MTVDLTSSHPNEYPQLPGKQKKGRNSRAILILFVIAMTTVGGAVFFLANQRHSTYELSFQENFADNRNGWMEKDSERLQIRIENGRYHIEPSQAVPTWLTWQHRPKFDLKRDFFIEAEFQSPGSNKKGYGIYFLGQRTRSFYQFLVADQGSCAVLSYSKGRYKTHRKWRRCPWLKKNLQSNRLRIERKGKLLRFFVNENPFTTIYAPKISGQYVGYVVAGGDRISSSEFKMGYINEESGLDRFLRNL